MELKLFSLDKLDKKQREKVNSFILSPNTTGEFINSLKYLEYHGSRFVEDSVVVVDVQSRDIKGVLLMTLRTESIAVSHSGTTFAGPIINLKDSYQVIYTIMSLMLEYYEKKYKEIYLKIPPYIYAKQPSEIVAYILQQRGYVYEMSGLANVLSLSGLRTEEDLIGIYTSSRRNHLKKVLKSGRFMFEKKQEVSFDIWKHMNEVLQEKFESKTTHTYEEIKELKSRVPDEIVPYEVRTKEGEYAAFALVYKLKNVFHTQYLDLNYKFTGEYPNLLLIHQLILEAMKEGYAAFSFGASTENSGAYLNEGLYAYKNGYGGGSILLPVYKKIIS